MLREANIILSDGRTINRLFRGGAMEFIDTVCRAEHQKAVYAKIYSITSRGTVLTGLWRAL